MTERNLTLVSAIALVLDDQRQGWASDGVSDADLITHVRDILVPSDRPSGPGWDAVTDDGTLTAAAYNMVLRATNAEIEGAL